MNDIFSEKIFDEKNFGEILKEIYDNTHKKNEIAEDFLNKILENLEKDPKKFMSVLLAFKELFETSVKNDDTLVKLSMIIQRIFQKNTYIQNSLKKTLRRQIYGT